MGGGGWGGISSLQGGHPQAEIIFPDFSLTKILWFYDLFVFSQPISDKFPSLVH